VNDDKILKKAVELYEKEKNKGNESIDKQALNELNIPSQYYEKAKQILQQKKKKLTQFIPIIFFSLIGVFYSLFIMLITSYPSIPDFSYEVSHKKYLTIELKVINPSNQSFELFYELFSPDEIIYDQKSFSLFSGGGSKDFSFKTEFTKIPKEGEWTIKIYAKLKSSIIPYRKQIFIEKLKL